MLLDVSLVFIVLNWIMIIGWRSGCLDSNPNWIFRKERDLRGHSKRSFFRWVFLPVSNTSKWNPPSFGHSGSRIKHNPTRLWSWERNRVRNHKTHSSPRQRYTFCIFKCPMNFRNHPFNQVSPSVCERETWRKFKQWGRRGRRIPCH